MRRELGRVESVRLGIEDHGILTCVVRIRFGSSSQGFGGLFLDGYDKEKKRRTGWAPGSDWIRRLCALFGAEDIVKDIVDKPVYALYESDRLGDIVGLQRIEPDGGATFLLSEWREDWKSEVTT